MTSAPTVDPLGAVLAPCGHARTLSAELQEACHNAFRRLRCKTCDAW